MEAPELKIDGPEALSIVERLRILLVIARIIFWGNGIDSCWSWSWGDGRKAVGRCAIMKDSGKGKGLVSSRLALCQQTQSTLTILVRETTTNTVKNTSPINKTSQLA